MSSIKPIAIHLPQFHPFPENDEWWGTGFTEWTNVTKATPQFEGHYQPHLPTDLGFYDLRLEEARIAQISLAKEHGIYGFCYYHYWFNGKRVMNEPLDRMLKNPKEDFPFMLCWANENWTRRWDGMDQEVLLKQNYNSEDDLNHIEFLCRSFFSDERYIKVAGKPFLVIYRPALFPDIKGTLTMWREVAKRHGFDDLYIGFMNNFSFDKAPLEYGFDCKIDFQPNFSELVGRKFPNIFGKIKYRFGVRNSPYYRHDVYSYKEYVDKITNLMKNEPNIYPGITPGWDNTARRSKGATILPDSTPELYGRWLEKIKEVYKHDSNCYLFINAWNEWAEGNHLEPCIKWGKAYLEMTKKVLTSR